MWWRTLRFVVKSLREKAVGRRPLGQILARQRQRLRRMIAHAQKASPFYAERLRGVDPERCELADLPVVTKAEMMRQLDWVLTDRSLRQVDLEEFVSDPARLGQWFHGRYAVTRTSGTEGVAALIVQNREMMELPLSLQMTRGTVFPSSLLAAVGRMLRRARMAAVTVGRGFYPSAAALAYAPPAAGWFIDRLWLRDVDPLEEVVERLNRFQPEVLTSYASVLETLAREQQDGRLRLGRDRPLRQVINISEPLSDGARQRISEAFFGLPVTDTYASGECMALSCGCPQGHGMHLNADWAVLEVVDRHNRPVEPGRPGEKALLSNLYNTVQPFLRYELPDVVTMSPEPCPCGSPWPLIRRVEGRTDEVLWVGALEHGYRRVHPYVFLDVLDAEPALGWYQVVQRQRNRFVLRAAPAPGRDLRKDELRRALRRGLDRFALGGLLEVDVEISREPPARRGGGKVKRITSEVGPPAGAATG